MRSARASKSRAMLTIVSAKYFFVTGPKPIDMSILPYYTGNRWGGNTDEPWPRKGNPMMLSDDAVNRLMIARASVKHDAPGVYAPVPAAEEHDALEPFFGAPELPRGIDAEGIEWGRVDNRTHRPAYSVWHGDSMSVELERVADVPADDAPEFVSEIELVRLSEIREQTAVCHSADSGQVDRRGVPRLATDRDNQARRAGQREYCRMREAITLGKASPDPEVARLATLCEQRLEHRVRAAYARMERGAKVWGNASAEHAG